ncbi:MAG: phosphoadenosine phosphosulfate reductase family protein [Bacteroidaceae bacterium]|nr:phosphoadenosine phosphosulfate reductase family protein [Bacteroidaceae bacterium]
MVSIEGVDVWITGLRRSQSVTRTDMQIIEYDTADDVIKLNPLMLWSDTKGSHPCDIPVSINNRAGKQTTDNLGTFAVQNRRAGGERQQFNKSQGCQG